MQKLRVLAVLLTVATACGDNNPGNTTPDAGGMPDSGVDEDGCRILTLGPRDLSFNLIDQLLGVRYPVTPNLDTGREDVLHVELWDSTTPGQPALTTGDFDLATQTNLATCQHCVWVDVDATDDGTVRDVYIATQGTLTIDKVTDPLEPVFAGHSSRIVMRRATVGDNVETTLVPNGDCVSIQALAFDTTPTPGAAFTRAGVPSGGLFSGAEEKMTADQAKLWGGQADQPFDPNYHKAADTLDRIDRTALGINGSGVGYAVGLYAQDQRGRNGIPLRDDRTRHILRES